MNDRRLNIYCSIVTFTQNLTRRTWTALRTRLLWSPDPPEDLDTRTWRIYCKMEPRWMVSRIVRRFTSLQFCKFRFVCFDTIFRLSLYSTCQPRPEPRQQPFWKRNMEKEKRFSSLATWPTPNNSKVSNCFRVNFTRMRIFFFFIVYVLLYRHLIDIRVE